ncbi:hypothetical protein C0J52_13140, partial [Blattella germanica]
IEVVDENQYSEIFFISTQTLQISESDAEKAVSLIEDGRSQQYVARALGHRFNVLSNALERLRNIQERKDLPIDRFVVLCTLRNRHSSAGHTQRKYKYVMSRGVTGTAATQSPQRITLEGCAADDGYCSSSQNGAKSLLRRINYVIFKILRSLNTPQWAPYALEVPKMQIKYGYFGCLYET